MMTPVLIALTLALAADDAPNIVRRAVERELAATGQPRDYTYRFREVARSLATDGSVRKTDIKTFEVLILYGKQFTRLIERDGHPLPEPDARKEQARFDREVQRRARLIEPQRAKEDQEDREEDRKRRDFIRQIPDLYDFTLEGDETIEGREAWVISARPRKDAKPRGLIAGNLSKLHGRLWIDKAEARWIRVQADALRSINFGWFLGSVGHGSRITFEQTRVADDVWLPRRVAGRLIARLVVKRLNLESETTYFDYRRFQTDSRILSGAQ
ncbi:MAG: hypothetical protein SFV54_18870 [Bryobacteraceae bacterium]|nr:hypothetical protein [Bryobacteraceae bacterium]